MEDTSAAPTGPSESTPTSPVPDETAANESSSGDNELPSPVVQRRLSKSKGSDNRLGHRDRFFILKSLTLEDLELSVRTGVWATQSHNEESLNEAFKVFTLRQVVCFSTNQSLRRLIMFTWFSQQTSLASTLAMLE